MNYHRNNTRNIINTNKRKKKVKSTSKKTNSNTVWKSGLKEIPHTIFLTEKLKYIIDTIQKEVGRNEFTILVKGKWSDKGFLLSEDYYIPEQKVTSSSVDYDNDLRELREEEGYNTLLHSHPFTRNGASYSGADETSVNMHFDAAMLLDGDNNLCKGKCMVSNNGGVLKIDMDIEIISPDYDISPNIDNIKESSTYSYNKNNNKDNESKDEEELKEPIYTGYRGFYLWPNEKEEIEEETGKNIEELSKNELTVAFTKIKQKQMD